MRKLFKILMFLPLSLGSAALLSSCDSQAESKVLRILNCEDYIYEYDPSAEEKETWDSEMEELGIENYKDDVIDQFVKYWADNHGGEEIEVVYDTFDTNETMFNELQTGKTTYDVIVPSDYMIQKLISNDMLHKISEKNKDDLWENISPYLIDKFNSIEASCNEVSYKISEFAVPYMWGTVGIMYNPSYYVEESNGALTEDDVHDLFMDWDSLYTNEYIKGTYSIKDSVRDTYAVSLIHTYRDEIANLTEEEIQEGKLGQIFNRNSPEEMALVKNDMLDLKDAAFGFECDSGKTDMVDGKVGANMCWSGDATWAITEAGKGDNPKDLYYAVPTSYDGDELKGASNIWFDGLCMPKNTDHEDNLTLEEQAQYDLAEEFIKFMCMPKTAVQNCYCVGYTPAVAANEVLDYMLWCYEAEDEEEDTYEYDLTYFFDGSVNEDYYDNNNRIVIVTDYATAKKELAAQYPEDKILNRLAIMQDFGKEGNTRLLDLWEQVRTNALPVWAIILFSIEGVAAALFVVYLVTRHSNRKKDKKARI